MKGVSRVVKEWGLESEWRVGRRMRTGGVGEFGVEEEGGVGGERLQKGVKEMQKQLGVK